MSYIATYNESHGCNSWTYCRVKTTTLEANSDKEALEAFKKFVKAKYYHGEYPSRTDTLVSDCTILEVKSSTIVNIKELYEDLDSDRKAEEQRMIEKNERSLLKNLKKKYEEA